MLFYLEYDEWKEYDVTIKHDKEARMMNTSTEKIRHTSKIIAIITGIFLLLMLIYLNPSPSLLQTGLVYGSFLSFVAGAIL